MSSTVLQQAVAASSPTTAITASSPPMHHIHKHPRHNSPHPLNPALRVNGTTCTRSKSTSRLLNIAPELRDQIYIAVLTACTEPPIVAPSIQSRRRMNNLGYQVREHTTWYAKSAIPHPALGLLSACQQTREEVLATIGRIKHQRNNRSKHSNYELDLIFCDERQMFPSWKHLGHISPVVNEVRADLRIMGEYDPVMGPRGWNSGWRPFDGWPPSLLWGMFNLMQRFLKHGPAFDELAPKEDALHLRSVWEKPEVLRLGTLILNVVTPTEVEMEGRQFVDFEASSLSHRPFDAENKGVIRAGTVVMHLLTFIPHLLRRNGYAAPFADELYAKVGTIQVCLDGVQQEKWIVNRLEKKNASTDASNLDT